MLRVHRCCIRATYLDTKSCGVLQRRSLTTTKTTNSSPGAATTASKQNNNKDGTTVKKVLSEATVTKLPSSSSKIDSKSKAEALQRLREWKRKQKGGGEAAATKTATRSKDIDVTRAENLQRVQQWRRKQRAAAGGGEAAAITTPTISGDGRIFGGLYWLQWGVPFVLFSYMGFLVVQSAVEGRLKEKSASENEQSQSWREAALKKEHDDMFEKITRSVKEDDFDNTKRIERPEEILERRRKERQQRNRWYNRLRRYLFGEGKKKE